MCTAMVMNTLEGDSYFGRTMDFSYPLEPELYYVPKGYEWNNVLNTHRIRCQYSFMGIGQDISPIAFADGVNEMGFGAAVLYFPGYAGYDTPDLQDPSVPSIAAIELTGFLLGLSASVEQAASILRTIRIVGVEDPVTSSIAPLHWLIADQSGACMVVEKTAEGLNLMDNPIGVLSNSPDFQWHMTNLRNYMNVMPYQYQEIQWDSVKLTPFGQGAGAMGLPGDFTPPSRFVRTAYAKSHAAAPSGREDAVVTCLHIMEGVSIPRGNVVTMRGTDDYTQYTAFSSLSTGEYYFKTYNNSGITAVKMPDSHNGAQEIVSLARLTGPPVFNSLA